jgi:hypothetical protein
MKTIIQNLTLAFVAVFAAGLLFVPNVSAVTVDNLVIEFENSPLFSEANFIPGDGVTRWVKVTNNSQNTQGVLIEAINFSNSGDLGDNLELTIKEGSNELYKDTLTNFFSYGELFLSNVAGDGGSTQYDLNVRFPEGADNTSMEDSLSFDILIGFSGEGGADNGGGDTEVVITGGGGGSSGGGGSQGTSGYRGLQISNEAIFDIIPVAGTAEAFWNTNHAATSQVVYGLVSSGPYTLDLNDPKFGYPFATSEDSTKVTEHHMNLFGLILGETYNYRVISHASPATVSFEHTFTVPVFDSTTPNTETGNTTGDPVVQNKPTKEVPSPVYALNNAPVTNSNNPVFSDPTEEENETIVLKEDSSDNEPKTQDQKNDKGLASIFSAFSFDKLFSPECVNYTAYLLLIFVIAYLARSLWEKKNESSHLSKKELISNKIMYFIKITVGLLIAAFIFGISCSIDILLMVLVLFIILYFLNKRKKNKN